MDPGTLGCTWIAWPEAEHRREFHFPETTAKMLAKVGTNCTNPIETGTVRANWRQKGSLTGFLTHAQSGVNAPPHKGRVRRVSGEKSAQD
jgi:hypothetical protein